MGPELVQRQGAPYMASVEEPSQPVSYFQEMKAYRNIRTAIEKRVQAANVRRLKRFNFIKDIPEDEKRPPIPEPPVETAGTVVPSGTNQQRALVALSGKALGADEPHPASASVKVEQSSTLTTTKFVYVGYGREAERVAVSDQPAPKDRSELYCLR